MSYVKFLVFADFHYKKKMYPSSVPQLCSIFDRASSEGCEFVVHAGDLCNDYKGSPELVRAYLENAHGMPVFGVYGNHELESRDNSMQTVTPKLSNRTEQLVFGTESGGIEDGSIGYYYTDIKNFRLIFLDTNYSLTPDNEYEHNRTASWGKPAENTASDSLGDKQLDWLRRVLLDAAGSEKCCIVFSHASFSGIWKSAPDAEAVRGIFREANALRKNTVLLAVNGHYHTDHAASVEGVCYFDCHAAINGWWQSKEFHPYKESDESSPAYTFDYSDYDEDGRLLSSCKMPYSKLRMGSQSLFFRDPLSAVITVSDNGEVNITGMSTSWAYGISGGLTALPEARIKNYSSKNNSEA